MSELSEPRILSCILPRVFPDISWLWAAKSGHTVVIHDNLHYSRKAHIHRGKIPTPNGPQWLYIPLKPDADGRTLSALKHEPTRLWLPALHKSLIMNYRNSIYFDFYEAEVLDDLKRADSFEFFTDFALFLTEKWLTYLDFSVLWKRASVHFPTTIHPDELAKLENCQAVILDPGSKHFMPKTSIPATKVFHHPEYRHHFGFEAGAPLFDLLFSCGPESWKIFDRIENPLQNLHSTERIL